MNNMTDSTPDAMDDLARASTDQARIVRGTLPTHVRSYAADQLATASALISDATPECESFNLDEASACIRAALRALATRRAR